MKKRFLALVAIAALVMAPTFADVLDSAKTSMENVQSKIMDNTTHPKWSAGLSLGTNSGIQVNYRANNDLTMETIVGFGVPTPDLNVECYGMYKVSDFQINDAMFNVNAGLGVSVGYDFDSQFNVTPLVAGEITYSFDDNFPMDLGVRVGLGPNFAFNDGVMTVSGLGWTSGVFGLWRFI